MMVKRKLNGTVDESSADQEICKSNATVHAPPYIACEKPGGLHLYM